MNDIEKFHLKIAYGKASDAADVVAKKQSFPCKSGCAWCCRRPVMVTQGDVALLRDGIAKMTPEALGKLTERATAFAGGFAPESRAMIRGRPDLAPAVFEKTWPLAGVPCPALEETTPGHGTCSLYEHRPLACRLHYAKDAQSGSAKTCSPAGKGKQLAILDARGVHQRLIQEHRLSLAGLLGLEIFEAIKEGQS